MATNQTSNPQVVSTKEKTQRIIEQREALKALWLALVISDTPPSNRQCAIWIMEHDYPAIEQALLVTAQWLNRQDDPDNIEQERLIKYASEVLKAAKFDKMTPEERAQRLSDIRSIAGKMGARAKWQNQKKEICQSLPSVCQICHFLPDVCRCGSGSPSGSYSPSPSRCEGEAQESKPAAAAPPKMEKPASTPFENLGENREPRTNPKTKTRQRSCSKCGGKLKRNENHVCPKPSDPLTDDFWELEELAKVQLDKAWLGDVYEGPDVSVRNPNGKLASFLDGD